MSATVLAPHDLLAEGAVLSAVLLEPKRLDNVRGIVSPESFFSDANRRVFDAILVLDQAGSAVDIITVAARLRDIGQLNQIGGTQYLYQLTDATPAVGNVESHALIVRDKSRLRRMIALCQRRAAEGYGDVGELQTFLEGAENELSELVHSGARTTLETVGMVLQRALALLTSAAARGQKLVGQPTGLADLDAMTGGLYEGDLYVLAGRPGSGKSAAAVTISLNIGTMSNPVPEDRPAVALFSLEMPRDQIALRVACAHSGVSNARIRQGTLTAVDWQKLAQSCAELSDVPVWIDDTPAITLLELRARVRNLQRQIAAGRAEVRCKKLGVVVIDYLQLMRGHREKGDNREQEVASISKGLKAMAKELDVPVIALAQLNRDAEKTKDKRPTLSTLRESGSLEQDADGVWLMFREHYYDKEAPADEAELIIAKQRNGPTGTVRLYFDPPSMKFSNRARDDEWRQDFENGDDAI